MFPLTRCVCCLHVFTQPQLSDLSSRGNPSGNGSEGVEGRERKGRERKEERRGHRDGQTAGDRGGPPPNQCNHSSYRTATQSVGTLMEKNREGGRLTDRKAGRKAKKKESLALAGHLHLPLASSFILFIGSDQLSGFFFFFLPIRLDLKKQAHLEEIPGDDKGVGGGEAVLSSPPRPLTTPRAKHIDGPDFSSPPPALPLTSTAA